MKKFLVMQEPKRGGREGLVFLISYIEAETKKDALQTFFRNNTTIDAVYARDFKRPIVVEAVSGMIHRI